MANISSQPLPRHGLGICHAGCVQSYASIAPPRAPARRGIPADPLKLPRGRRFRENADGTVGAISARGKIMPRHSETKILPYSPEQLFALVADVERYDEFLPWVVAVRVRSSSESETVADLVVGFSACKGRFTSRITKGPVARIIVDYVQGPLKYLHKIAVTPTAVAGPSWAFRRLPQIAIVRNTRGSNVRPALRRMTTGSSSARALRIATRSAQRRPDAEFLSGLHASTVFDRR